MLNLIRSNGVVLTLALKTLGKKNNVSQVVAQRLQGTRMIVLNDVDINASGGLLRENLRRER